ncbi:MAG: beta-ketoacyl synthase N-terminal-like domain-containing protein, partial [Acidimicrobiia bacterium]
MQGGRRVAVTGIGVVASAGIGVDAFWAGLLGTPPDGPRQIHDWDPSPWFGPKDARRSDRFSQFAVAAAEEALADAGTIGADLDRSGVFVATGVGGLNTLEEQIVVNHEKGSKRVSPFLVPMMMCNAAAATVSMRFGWRGPCEATVTACAASTHAIGNAARLVAMGVCDAMLAGGSETAITPTGVAGVRNMTAL